MSILLLSKLAQDQNSKAQALELIIKSSQPLSVRVNLTLLFYNCTEDSDSFKATVFLKLAEMCAKEN
jgi:hypothetical protein